MNSQQVDQCRLCLRLRYSSDAGNISSKWHIVTELCPRSNDIYIHTMLFKCLSIKITLKDNLPRIICSTCLLKVNDFYDFKKQIELNDKILKESIKETRHRNGNNMLAMENPSIKDIDIDSDYHRRIDSWSSPLAIDEGVDNIFSSGDKNIDPKVNRKPKKVEQFSINKVEKMKFVCFICSHEFTSYKQTKTHIREVHFGLYFKCIVCQALFISEIKLNNHQLYKHFVYTDSDCKRYRCDLCYKAYTTLHNLNMHKLTHTRPKQCEICDKKFYKAKSFEIHLNLHKGIRNHQCDICMRSFTTPRNLADHKKTHSTIRPHVCSVCHKGFIKPNELRLHFRIHSGVRPYLCTQCGKTFTRSSHLKSHFRTHTGERPYKCNECAKAFAQSGDLIAHTRTHTGEKPYLCKVCGKRFNQTCALKSHQKSHTGERNHKCIVCEKTFTQSSSLARHNKLHSRNLLSQSISVTKVYRKPNH